MNPYICTAPEPSPAGISDVSSSPIADAVDRILDFIERSLGGPVSAVLAALASLAGLVFTPVDWLLVAAHLPARPLTLVLGWVFPVVQPVAGAAATDPVLISAILLLLFVRVCLYPAARRAKRNSVKLAFIQPAITRLQKLDLDKDELNSSLMELYKKHSVNPMSGCIWILPSLILLVSFYGVIEGLLVRAPSGGFAPTGLAPTSRLAGHLGSLDYLTSWGMDLSKPMSEVGACDRSVPYLCTVALLLLVSVAAPFLTPSRVGQGSQRRMAVAMSTFTVIFAIALPVFIVILRCVDALYAVAQTAALERYQQKQVVLLRHDPVFQQQVAETYVDIANLLKDR